MYLLFQYNQVPLTTCCVFPAKKHFCNTQKRTFFSTLNKLKYEIVVQTSLAESYCYFNELQSCQQTIYRLGSSRVQRSITVYTNKRLGLWPLPNTIRTLYSFCKKMQLYICSCLLRMILFPCSNMRYHLVVQEPKHLPTSLQ